MKIENSITIFLSSPTDMFQEREAVFKIIKQFNTIWCDYFKTNLKLITWENDSYPGIGSDGQQVINSQLGYDYDIYVGIIGNRLGTPTPRYFSGTIEEFYLAYNRYKINKRYPKILFYFMKITNKSIDIESFKDELIRKGVYFRIFEDIENFKILFNIHISKVFQEIIKEKSIQIINHSQKVKNSFHYLNFILNGSKYLDNCIEILHDLNDEIYTLNHSMEIATIKIKNFIRNKPKNYKSLAIKEIDKTASVMLEMSNKSNKLLYPYSNQFQLAIECFSYSFLFFKELKTTNINSIQDFHGALYNLKNEINDVIKLIKKYIQSIENITGITSKLTNAKTKMISSLKLIENEFQKSLSIVDFSNNLISDFIQNA